MKIEELKLADIKPYERNQKKHPDEQINNIAISIDKYGFIQPIVVDGNNEIVIGHGRCSSSDNRFTQLYDCKRYQEHRSKNHNKSISRKIQRRSQPAENN